MKNVVIKKASQDDISGISQMTKRNRGVMLFRSPEKVKKMLGNYFIAVSNCHDIIGCCGFKTYPGGDTEIISLAVDPKFRGKRIGRKLIDSCVNESLKRNTGARIMAFANPRAKKLFLNSGFVEAGVQLFHEKILEDCKNCPRNKMKKGLYQCNETALVFVRKKK